MRHTIFYLFAILIPFLTKGQSNQVYEDTLALHDDYFFDHCSDSLSSIYQVHFEKNTYNQGCSETGKIVRYLAKFEGKYGVEKTDSIFRNYQQCLIKQNQPALREEYEMRQIHSNNKFIFTLFENDTIFSDNLTQIFLICFNDTLATICRNLNDPKLLIEVQSHGSIYERKGCSQKRLQAIKKIMKSSKLDMKWFLFKDCGTSVPLDIKYKENSSLNVRFEFKILEISD